MSPIITSLLDNDIYKFTMMSFVHHYYPNTNVEIGFINRDKSRKFTQRFVDNLKLQVKHMGELTLSDAELLFLLDLPLGEHSKFIKFLKTFKLNSDQVDIGLTSENDLVITIRGKWKDVILWEVPLMATISELYFKNELSPGETYFKQSEKIKNKIKFWEKNNSKILEFGTRRRFSKISQQAAIQCMANSDCVIGTSNINFAMKYNIPVKGTIAHELIMGISSLEGIRHANRHALEMWSEYWNGNDLLTALPDTYGTCVFLNDFNETMSNLWTGVRHDSGCPFKFVDLLLDHYTSYGISPNNKTLVFSNGLKFNEVPDIQSYAEAAGFFNVAFGIGTNITNDFEGIQPLNMVIKLFKCDGLDVVKLSDDPGKAMGTLDAIRVAKYLTKGTPLD